MMLESRLVTSDCTLERWESSWVMSENNSVKMVNTSEMLENKTVKLESSWSCLTPVCSLAMKESRREMKENRKARSVSKRER